MATNRRAYFLVMVMAIAFVTMAWFIFSRNELLLSDILIVVLFGILLVGLALFSVHRGRWVGIQASWDWPKYVFGSFALSFGSWMLGSTLLLPLIGFAGFEMLSRPWFSVALCFLALVFLPFVRRFML